MKPLNLTGNMVSLAFFLHAKQVDFSIGLAMGMGQMVGAMIGSTIVINKNEKNIRYLFSLLILIIVISLFMKRIFN